MWGSEELNACELRNHTNFCMLGLDEFIHVPGISLQWQSLHLSLPGVPEKWGWDPQPAECWGAKATYSLLSQVTCSQGGHY